MRIQKGKRYRIPGSTWTIEKVPWGYMVRDADGNEIGTRSTKEAALRLLSDERDDRGQYKHHGGWDRLCVCGHRLGEHTAEKARGERPCLAYPCECQLFRPQRRNSRADEEDVTDHIVQEISYGPRPQYLTHVAPVSSLTASRRRVMELADGLRLPFISKAPIYAKELSRLPKRDHKTIVGLLKGGYLGIYRVRGPLPGEHPSHVGAHADYHYVLRARAEASRKNPSDQLYKAKKLFVDFHQFEPTKVGAFKNLRIPKDAYHVGEAKVMYYVSDKLNPETSEDEGWIHYYHDHEGGVGFYLPDDSDGERAHVPDFFHVDALVRLGDCEGFEYEDFDGETVAAEGTGRLPEWYATPCGRGLLVIQNKRRVLALLWGGSLDVRPEGVVG